MNCRTRICLQFRRNNEPAVIRTGNKITPAPRGHGNIHALRACVFIRRNKVYDVSGIGKSGKLRRTEILGLCGGKTRNMQQFRLRGEPAEMFDVLLECYAESADRCRIFLADIAKMPRFICNMRYVLLSRRIAKDETVIRTMRLQPFKLAYVAASPVWCSLVPGAAT